MELCYVLSIFVLGKNVKMAFINIKHYTKLKYDQSIFFKSWILIMYIIYIKIEVLGSSSSHQSWICKVLLSITGLIFFTNYSIIHAWCTTNILQWSITEIKYVKIKQKWDPSSGLNPTNKMYPYFDTLLKFLDTRLTKSILCTVLWHYLKYQLSIVWKVSQWANSAETQSITTLQR